MRALLVAGLALTLLSAALFARVGAWLWRRPTTREARLASRMYATWWLAVAAVVLVAGAHTVLGLAGVTALAPYVFLAYAVDVPLAVALWALLNYLVFLYTGRRAALWPLTVAYALFVPFAFYYTSFQGDRVLRATDWDIRAVGTSAAPAWLNALFGVVLAGPALAIVLAYAFLLARVREPPQRYRLSMTALAFALWFAPVLVGFLLGWQSQPWFAWLYEAPGVLAAGLVLAAYRPPAFVQRRIDEAEARYLAAGGASP
jgi:hypothetical protein